MHTSFYIHIIHIQTQIQRYFHSLKSKLIDGHYWSHYRSSFGTVSILGDILTPLGTRGTKGVYRGGKVFIIKKFLKYSKTDKSKLIAEDSISRTRSFNLV